MLQGGLGDATKTILPVNQGEGLCLSVQTFHGQLEGEINHMHVSVACIVFQFTLPKSCQYTLLPISLTLSYKELLNWVKPTLKYTFVFQTLMHISQKTKNNTSCMVLKQLLTKYKCFASQQNQQSALTCCNAAV